MIKETAIIEGVRAKLITQPLLLPLIPKSSGWGTRKFKQGKQIKSIIDLVMRLEAGGWVYLRDQPKHPSILMNMSVVTLRGFCRHGAVFVAEANDGDRKEMPS